MMISTIRNTIVSAILLSTGFASAQTAQKNPALAEKWKEKSMHNISIKDLEGQSIDLSQFKGKVVIVVNVASQCGYTPQYAGMQKLYDELKSKGVVVLGVPSNDFGSQEPGSAQDIRSFCNKNYGVTFPMLEKSQTKEGDGQSQLYEFLGAVTGHLPAWNFSKYVIGKDGKPIEFFGSSTKPDSPELRKCIENALTATPPIAASQPTNP